MKHEEFMKEMGINYTDLEVLRKALIESNKMHEPAYQIILDIQKAGGVVQNGCFYPPKAGSTCHLYVNGTLMRLRAVEVCEEKFGNPPDCTITWSRIA